MAGHRPSNERTPGSDPDDGADEQALTRRGEFVVLPGGGRDDEADRHRPVDSLRLRDVIGETLREERRQQGRTLAEVAREAAVSLPYLSEVERGSKEVSSDVLHSIHHALGLELDEVLERATLRLRVRPQRNGPTLLAA